MDDRSLNNARHFFESGDIDSMKVGSSRGLHR